MKLQWPYERVHKSIHAHANSLLRKIRNDNRIKEIMLRLTSFQEGFYRLSAKSRKALGVEIDDAPI